ncbi:hypothetical protein JVU11DRAFT_1950 [Chiua virens]|nr:hypothetical protein JVU11DRAFT_1950 [Chiua virens]
MEYIVAFSFFQDNAEPTSANFQGFPFPYFKLTKEVLVELELARPDEVSPVPVHYFNPELDYWIKMKVDSTVIITSPGHFDRLYGCAPSSQEQVNFRTKLVQERRQFKCKLVEAEVHRDRDHTPWPRPQPQPQPYEVFDLSICSDLDVEDDAPTVVGGLTPQCHSQLQVTDSRDTRHADGTLSDEDDTLPVQPIPEVRHACIIPGVSPQAAKFPSSFYTVDVHRSFLFERRGNLTLEMQFESFFNIPFKSSTYYDHKARWSQAPRDARDHALAAGYEEDGQYSRFMGMYPAKDADLKAIKRKMHTAPKKL